MFGSRFADISLKGDMFGDVTTAIISLPLALAFSIASGAGAEAGLWGAIMVGLFAALFGDSSSLISEPTGPMTVIMAAVMTSMVTKYPETGMAMTFLYRGHDSGCFSGITWYLKAWNPTLTDSDMKL